MMKKLLVLLLALVMCAGCAPEEKDNRYDAIGGCGFDENTLLPVQRDGLWGFVNASGERVVACQWEAYQPVNAGKIAVQKDGLWGCIDLEGNVLVEPEWDYLSVWDDGSYDVTRGGDSALMAADGEMVTELGEYFYAGWNIDGAILVTDGEKSGKLHPDGSIVIPLVWEGVGYFHDDLAYANRSLSDGFCYIDRAGNVAIPGPFQYADDFEDGLAAVCYFYSTSDGNRAWNLIDRQGNAVFDEGFDVIRRISDGMYTVARDGKIGYVSAAGELTIPPQYEGADLMRLSYDSTYDFSHGRAVVRRDDRLLWIDGAGNLLAELPYAHVEPWGGALAFVRNEDGLWGAAGADGELIIPCEWEQLDGKWAVPDQDCQIVAARRGSEIAWFNQQGQSITGRTHDRETTSGTFDWRHLYLLEDGVLTIWNADGTQAY